MTLGAERWDGANGIESIARWWPMAAAAAA
jgi:hypothetical protein